MIPRALRGRLAGLGNAGLAALAVLAAVGGLHLTVLSSLQARSAQLGAELDRRASALAPDAPLRQARTPAAQMAAFYRFFDQGQRLDDWLAKLYATAVAAGLELKAADYRLGERRHRLERYQIRLPVTGSYAQIRAFLQGAQMEIPVLSVEQASFRRKDADGRVEAELVLTLHLLST